MNRRLAAILFYDVVGFSRAIEKSESATIEVLKENYKKIIKPLARHHNGRAIKAMGDGGLLEFSSAVDAVLFSISMQYAVEKSNLNNPTNRKLAYRIGINIGDVIVDGEDLIGEGVNIASRLEGQAQPGGICVHSSVRDQVLNKVDIDFQDLGELSLKNIEKPARSFSVLLNQKTEMLSVAPGFPTETSSKPAKTLERFSLGATVFVLSLAALLLWQPWGPTHTPASVDRMAYPLPDKPSLAVLPFTDMSEEKEQDYFADGMTDDLITDLSRVSGLFIVARNSTFAYKEQSVSIARVAEDLGVRYILEGSIRRAGDQVRVNAQLIDATTGGHVWAERFDGQATDVFAIQDEFVRKIARALAVNLTKEEKSEIAKGQTSNIAARQLFQEGWESYLGYSATENAKAVESFKQALSLDPEYGRAHAALSLAYLRGCKQRWNEELGMSVDEANEMAQRSLAETASRPSSLANVAASRINLYNERYEKARTEASRAIAKDPNDPEGYVALAWAMITMNQPDTGLELLDRAVRQNPTYPNYYVLAIAMAHYTLGEMESAGTILSEALERDPNAHELAAVAAAVFSQLGRHTEAHFAMKKWMPDASPQQLRSAPFSYHFPYSWLNRPEIVANIVDGLHMAALSPDDPIGELVDRLKSSENSDRVQAAELLGMFGARAESAVQDLIEALDDPVMTVRKEAAVALGKIGPSAASALPALIAMSGERIVGMRARKAIEQISSK